MSPRHGVRTALVTGGAGFVGSHLTDRLVEEGWSVRVLDDFSSGREANLGRSAGAIELLRGDLRDEALIGEAVRGVEVVFHQAAVPSVPRSVAEPLRTNEVNVTGTLRLLEAARQAGVRRLVFAASSSAYGDTPELPKVETMPANPRSPYALQKYAGEAYCRLYTSLYGLETVALRYFNVFGPRQDPESAYAAVIPKFVTACLEGRAPRIYGDGEQTRDFTFVSDVAHANLLAASAEGAVGHVINVAGGARTSLNRLLEHVKELTGSRVEAVYEAARAGDVRDSLADLRRAEELLGYRPSVDVKQGLVETIDYFRKSLEGAVPA
jgi:nucleoside-diphosphate-sugar epimerase